MARFTEGYGVTVGSMFRAGVARPVAAVLLMVGFAAACGDSESLSPEGSTCTPSRETPAGTESRAYPWEGVERDVLVTVPPAYDGTQAMPLLLDLHGFGMTGETEAATTGFPEVAGARGYVVIEPTGDLLVLPDQYLDEPRAEDFHLQTWWNFLGPHPVRFDPEGEVTGDDMGADDIGFLTELLTAIEAELCIDTNRVFVTGFSNGAGMTTTMAACELPTVFAAAGPLGGVNINYGCPDGAPVPVAVLAIHAFDDHFIPYEGGDLVGLPSDAVSVPERVAQWAAQNGCQPEPTTRNENEWVVVTTWQGCDAPTELWSIDDWDHGWPRASSPEDEGHIDATEVLLDFFDAQA